MLRLCVLHACSILSAHEPSLNTVVSCAVCMCCVHVLCACAVCMCCVHVLCCMCCVHACMCMCRTGFVSRVQLFIIIATTGHHILKVVYACMHEQSPNHISLTKNRPRYYVKSHKLRKMCFGQYQASSTDAHVLNHGYYTRLIEYLRKCPFPYAHPSLVPRPSIT